MELLPVYLDYGYYLQKFYDDNLPNDTINNFYQQEILPIEINDFEVVESSNQKSITSQNMGKNNSMFN
jgi:hypothetical protein